MILSKTNLVNVVVSNIVSRYQDINIPTNAETIPTIKCIAVTAFIGLVVVGTLSLNSHDTLTYTNLVKAVVSGIVSKEAEQLPCSMNSVHLANSFLIYY